MPDVMIIDNGISNILNIVRGFQYWGLDVKLIDKPEELMGASRIVLPGVGAFNDGMEVLKSKKLVEPLIDFSKSGKPLLGVCLGMQMLLDFSEEFGEHAGLGLIPGRVKPIPLQKSNLLKRKVPNIGWSEIYSGADPKYWEDSILSQTAQGEPFYFVHSFMAIPENQDFVLAKTDYDGCNIAAVIRRDNIYGCQFHPEKSGIEGLKLLEEFSKL